MEIEIDEFRKRLNAEIANGNRELGPFIHREIRLAETTKASMMEEMDETTEEFLTAAAGKFDTYIFQLQEIEKELHLRHLALDQETALNDKLVRQQMSAQLETLEDLHTPAPEAPAEDESAT